MICFKIHELYLCGNVVQTFFMLHHLLIKIHQFIVAEIMACWPDYFSEFGARDVYGQVMKVPQS